MTRSRYFFNSSIIRQNLRQHGWIGIIYALGLLFSLPLQIFMSHNPYTEPVEVENLFRIAGEIQMLFIISLPVAAGLFLFRYLQAKSPSDLWHSLPLRREHILTANLASGLLLLLLPVWLTGAVVAILRQWSGNMYVFQGADIWSWCITVSILTLFLFCFSIFVGICTGQSVLQGIIIYCLLLLPAVLILLFDFHLSMYLYGYPEYFSYSFTAEKWSPLIHMLTISSRPFSSVELWIYGALTALFIGLSYLLYRKRHVEKSGQAIVFTYFHPLFKAGLMVCAMLISGSYFGQMKQEQGWVIGGYAIGAVMGYIVAEMVIRKTWQILNRKAPIEFAIYAVLLSLLLYIPASGLTGYEDRVPTGDKISGVYAGNSYWMYNLDRTGLGVSPITGEDPFTSDDNYIEAVRKLHLAVTENRPENISTKTNYEYIQYQPFTIIYRLDNGRELMRKYWVPLKGFEPELRAVMESEEFKRGQYAVGHLDKDMDLIRLRNSVGNKEVLISDPTEIKEFKEILRREILNMSFEDQMDDTATLANIEPVVKVDEFGRSSSYNYSWKSSYHELEKWLEQKGYADKVRTTEENIKSAKIIKNDLNGRLSRDAARNPDRQMELAERENRVKATEDKQVIADILEQQRAYSYESNNYLVKLEYNDGYTDHVMLRESDLTPALQSILNP